jgi:CDP-diacylglycerol--serine O-phosphatidyltransferase
MLITANLTKKTKRPPVQIFKSLPDVLSWLLSQIKVSDLKEDCKSAPAFAIFSEIYLNFALLLNNFTIQQKMRHIPNLITSLNLAAGFIAIIFASTGDLITASWFILAAMIFDFFDGFSARLLKAYSQLGKELDSLADVVSFGVAPALIIYHLIVDSVIPIPPSTPEGQIVVIWIYSLIPVIMPVCAALRLAKFNIDTTQTTSFKGLPTPANGLAVISVVIAANYSDSSLLKSFTGSPVALDIFTIVLSLLMVSRINLLSLKIINLKFKGNEGRYILAGMVIISLVFFGIGAAPLIIPFYIIASFLSILF